MFETLDLPFVQRGLIEIALLAGGAGLVGTWIVLRGQAFFAHAVGAAAFPGLVLAGGVGFAPLLGALGAAGAMAAAIALLERRGVTAHDSVIALSLVAALAVGVILASDVFESPASVEQLLFGSLLLIDATDHGVALTLTLLAVGGSLLFGARWLSTGFDSTSRASDLALLALIAGASVAVLHAMGALLAGALLVMPAATTRLLLDRMLPWQLATIGLAFVEGSAGLLLSVELNAPPGATIALLSGAVFAIAAAGRILVPRAPRAALPAIAALALVGLAGCGSDSAGDKPKVVASTTIVADIARQIAGGDFEVEQLLQPNTDPHGYEPRPNDIKALASADLVLASGLGLDGFVDEAVESSGTSAKLVEVGDAVEHPLEGGEEEAQGHGDEGDGHDDSGLDPHWWQNPRNAIAVAGVIATELKRAEPDAADAIDKRASDYLAELRRLDGAIARCVDTIPAARRKLVTSHDAFGYYAARYGLEIVGAVIPSTTTQAQPNSGALASLSRTIREQGVKAVFPEEALNPRVARAIAAQTGARADLELYGDALGPKDSPAATYTGLLKINTERIAEGLGGESADCSL